MPIKRGDIFTYEGINEMMRNPDRRWWQLWKPRFVRRQSQTFVVRGTDRSFDVTIWPDISWPANAGDQ